MGRYGVYLLFMYFCALWNMKNTTELAEGKIRPLMRKYFIPAFVGVVVNSLYNIVDRIYIGQGVGAEALSGVSVIFPIMLIMMGFSMLIGIGAGVMVSISLGRRDIPRAEKTLGTSVVLMVVVSLLMTVLGFVIKGPVLRSFGATETTYQYANDYLDIILFGVVFQVLGFSLNNIIRSEGNARLAMISMLLSAGINIILDPLFIFVFDMGVKGAAWATLISMVVLTFWVMAHFRSDRSEIRLKREFLYVDFPVMKDILAIGMAPFAMQIAGSVVQGLLNKKLILFGGDLAVGAMGIINSVTTLVVMTIVALNMAAQPIIGFNYGARSPERVREALGLSLRFATYIAIASFLVLEIFPGPMVWLFNSSSEELQQITIRGLRIYILAYPVVGYMIVAGNFFQSIGKAGLSMFMTLLRQVLILLPFLVMFPSFWGLTGIWVAFPVSDFLASLVVAWLLVREWRRLDHIRPATESSPAAPAPYETPHNG